MSNTAYLRPLITENFVFDFPSHFSTKELSDFAKTDFKKTTTSASQNMQAIMGGSEVLWYIKSKATNTIIGFVDIHFENQEQSIAMLDYELSNKLSKIELVEITNRIVQICFINLKLRKIKVSSPLNDFICQELKIYYNMTNNEFILK